MEYKTVNEKILVQDLWRYKCVKERYRRHLEFCGDKLGKLTYAANDRWLLADILADIRRDKERIAREG